MKEIKIQIPEGYEGIDEEKSNLAEGRIVFKKKEVDPWRFTNPKVQGFYVASLNSEVISTTKSCPWLCGNENIFATEKQAKSMLAMAQLSQIILNDKRFGGPITDKEWLSPMYKYVIDRYDNDIKTYRWIECNFRFLVFHTEEQRDLFLRENEDLIRQYFMLD